MNREGTLKELFRQKCSNVSAKYLLDIKTDTTIKGVKPSFEDLMKTLKVVDTELTAEGVRLLESYKTETGAIPDDLTMGFKSIITETIEAFVKQL
jgi:hypothetical protein